MFYYNTELKSFSRQLRVNMTDVEQLLWSKVRRKQLQGYQFYRQRIIGEYIVDFYCPKANLIIELDGGQHYTNNAQAYDAKRDHYFGEQGYHVLRVSNKEILENLNGVLEKIYEYL